jgi:hypothetical protein
MRDIYGDTADADLSVKQFSTWLEMLWAQGTRRTLQQYVDEGS